MEKNCNCPDIRGTPSGRQSLLWKLRVAEVQPSETKGNTVRTRPYSRKSFTALWKAGCTVHRPEGLNLNLNAA
jgi:hypothetical protein